MYFSQIYLSICFVYKLICRMCIFHKFMFKSVILHFCLQMFFFLTKCKFDSISFLYFGPWDWVQKFSRMYLFLLKFGTFIECYFILLGLGAKALQTVISFFQMRQHLLAVTPVSQSVSQSNVNLYNPNLLTLVTLHNGIFDEY